jgi:hypothetical protein
MLDTHDIFIKVIDFLIEEIKNIRREKSDLVARINMLENENRILKKKNI